MQAAAPNAKSVERAAERLRRTAGVDRVATIRQGSALRLVCHAIYVTGVDRARPTRCGDAVRVFATDALACRMTVLGFRKRHLPQRIGAGVIYFDAHAIARLVERGPFDPRSVSDAALLAAFRKAQPAILSALVLVEAAVRDGRLDEDLATDFPVPCPATGGLWVVECSTSGGAEHDATVVTYLGPSMLTSAQHSFATACGDGDLIGALLAYPDALRRTHVGAEAQAGLARLAASAASA
jgi:hypothetical protein